MNTKKSYFVVIVSLLIFCGNLFGDLIIEGYYTTVEKSGGDGKFIHVEYHSYIRNIGSYELIVYIGAQDRINLSWMNTTYVYFFDLARNPRGEFLTPSRSDLNELSLKPGETCKLPIIIKEIHSKGKNKIPITVIYEISERLGERMDSWHGKLMYSPETIEDFINKR